MYRFKNETRYFSMVNGKPVVKGFIRKENAYMEPYA
jgi:hypothetical protein